MTVRHCEAEFHPACTGIGVHRHHRLLRRHAGADATVVWVCAWCHDRIHREPAAAVAAGLIVRSWDAAKVVVSNESAPAPLDAAGR